MSHHASKPSIFRRRLPQKVLLMILGILLIVTSLRLIPQLIALPSAAQKPVDTFFVLGGSIKREIFVSELAVQFPNTRILISTGSDDPCTLRLFQRNNAPIEQVWLEKCANSTFSNFVFSQPLLSRWNARHIQLITSKSHLPRALWMAQIILGSHGIWVEPKLVPETGVPGNRESVIKTTLDVTRALIWAFISQIVQPNCSNVVQLSNINLKQWCEDGFSCEYQAKINTEAICEPFE
ncbi:MAG: YdcF family protein [Lyngbya sp.]|nr:YdcF family protein [Lyngbya sp.]